MGKNRERVRFSPRPGRRDRPGESHNFRTHHAARRDGFQDYYAVKSHLAAARCLVAGCGNTCAAMWPRSEVKSHGVMRAGRAALGAGHPPPPHTRWPWCMRTPTLVGARVPRARPAPRTRSDCRTSRAVGGPPRTSAPTKDPSHVPAPATFPSQPRSRRGFVGGAVRPVAESGGKRVFARFGPCAENVQGTFRRGRKCFPPRVSWGRAGNRDRLSRKKRDTGC